MTGKHSLQLVEDALAALSTLTMAQTYLHNGFRLLDLLTFITACLVRPSIEN